MQEKGFKQQPGHSVTHGTGQWWLLGALITPGHLKRCFYTEKTDSVYNKAKVIKQSLDPDIYFRQRAKPQHSRNSFGFKFCSQNSHSVKHEIKRSVLRICYPNRQDSLAL